MNPDKTMLKRYRKLQRNFSKRLKNCLRKRCYTAMWHFSETCGIERVLFVGTAQDAKDIIGLLEIIQNMKSGIPKSSKKYIQEAKKNDTP